MPAMDYQSSSTPFASIGRSILSIRRDQLHTVDPAAASSSSDQDQELEAFQKHVSTLFSDLSSNSDELLSLSWIRKLLDTFLICQEEFRVIFLNSRPLLSRAPLDRIVSDFFDRAVKALDVCNAVRDGVDQIRQWAAHLDIVLAALSRSPASPLGEGQIRRAKKALGDLAILMLESDRDSSSSGGGGSILSHRNRSFGRNSNSAAKDKKGHFRSLSWSVSRSWSASKQIQAIGSNLNAPRGNEISATNGLAVPVYTMSSVLLFAMWALVAAIPCQDRGIQAHFSVPRNFSWAAAVLSLHEKILEESKKKERKNSCGLLKEIHQIERITRGLMDVLDSVQAPMGEEKETEVRQMVGELMQVCEVLKEELEPLERQVRLVFHRIVRSRTEGLDCLNKPHNGE
ncbi:uncharacterized protein M6B38_285700 [Iris pallida]|uniref:Uncharacterized protein n=1 Tax=Iris pallida TaxID=29817 RepID=A0AAX6I018_IRIPA|nr:uncharacterized protein M6B38_285700 [Iris pallida]